MRRLYRLLQLSPAAHPFRQDWYEREKHREWGACRAETQDLGWKVCSVVEAVVATPRAMEALPPTPCLLISLLVRDRIKKLSLFTLFVGMIQVEWYDWGYFYRTHPTSAFPYTEVHMWSANPTPLCSNVSISFLRCLVKWLLFVDDEKNREWRLIFMQPVLYFYIVEIKSIYIYYV
jgi:hypothetical protein